jgi:hypothetical protein
MAGHQGHGLWAALRNREQQAALCPTMSQVQVRFHALH